MSDTPDTAVTTTIEGTNREFNPETNPTLRRVVVKTEVPSAGGIEQQGWMTNIPGAKVDLQQVGLHNMGRRSEHKTSMGEYERIYFTTASGTIYCARSLEDGAWEVEASNNPTIHTIKEPATLEVGQRFISPNTIDGKPELDTSAVQDITLVDRYGKPREHGVEFSKKQTDIGTQFVQAVQASGQFS